MPKGNIHNSRIKSTKGNIVAFAIHEKLYIEENPNIDSVLRIIDKLNRVPGAIDSNKDFVTDETYFGELQTDIPEDFLSGDETGTTIEIPDGAKFLFLCNPDVYYPDNFGTFQVTIKKLETEQSDSVFPIEIVISIILAIVAIIILFILYKRKKGNESKNITV